MRFRDLRFGEMGLNPCNNALDFSYRFDKYQRNEYKYVTGY